MTIGRKGGNASLSPPTTAWFVSVLRGAVRIRPSADYLWSTCYWPATRLGIAYAEVSTTQTRLALPELWRERETIMNELRNHL